MPTLLSPTSEPRQTAKGVRQLSGEGQRGVPNAETNHTNITQHPAPPPPAHSPMPPAFQSPFVLTQQHVAPDAELWHEQLVPGAGTDPPQPQCAFTAQEVVHIDGQCYATHRPRDGLADKYAPLIDDLIAAANDDLAAAPGDPRLAFLVAQLVDLRDRLFV